MDVDKAMNIKQPPCYDLSHWNTVPNFAAISPKPFLVITKASEGVLGVDPRFVTHMAGAKSIGAHRGAYHFHRKAIDGAGQARHFLNICNGYIDDDTLLILDVEEGGETAGQLKAWFDVVRSNRPRNRVAIYSRQNILNAIPMTVAQKEYFKDIMTWIAGYPVDSQGVSHADYYTAIPSFYVPDLTRWGPPWMWQYTDNGQVAGIAGECDCNWLDPKFVTILGQTQPPAEAITMNEWYTVNIDVRNIRAGAGASYTDIGDLYRGDVINVVEHIGGWYRLAAIWRKGSPVALPSANSSWCLDTYMLPASDPTPPPPPAVVKVPFDLLVEGMKPYHGELEKA